jgi:hypothetical protein
MSYIRSSTIQFLGQTESLSTQVQPRPASLLHKALLYMAAGTLLSGGFYLLIHGSRWEWAVVALAVIGRASLVCTRWDPSVSE